TPETPHPAPPLAGGRRASRGRGTPSHVPTRFRVPGPRSQVPGPRSQVPGGPLPESRL
ncbi:unnamed protein product, partial [Rangifer tarandus platyrhynchus]